MSIRSRWSYARVSAPRRVLASPATTARLPLLAAAVLVAALLAAPSGPAAARTARAVRPAHTAAAAGPVQPAPPAGGARTAQAADGDLYVDSATPCSDTGTGSETEPFCTIGAAADAVQPGQTVIVEPGDYAGTTISVSGTPSAPITFDAMDGQTTVTLDSGFNVSGAQDVVLSGFNVHAVQPFLISSSSGITITGGSADGTSETLPAVEVTGTSSNVTISKMTINSRDIDVQVGQGVTGAIVTTNTMDVTTTAAGVSAVLATDAPGSDIVSNTLVTNCNAGVAIAGTSPGTYLENNIIETGGFPVTSPSACADPAEATAFSVSAASTAQTVANYNLIDPVSGGALYSWGGTSYTSLASFTAATGQGTEDIAASPGLAGEFGGLTEPFYPSATSPAIDSADANAPGEQPTDQVGNPRADDPSVPNTGTGSGYYDRGAIEVEGPVTYGELTVQPDPADGPLAVTASAPITTSWTTNGPIGAYEFISGDGFPVVTTSASVEITFSTAGGPGVDVVQTADGFTGLKSNTQSADVTVGADYTPVTPTRIMDTRSGIGVAKGAIAADGDLTLPIPAIGQLSPADISAVAINVTVTEPTASGTLTVFTQSGAGAATSNINFVAHQTIANLVTIQPSGGAITFQNNGTGTVQVIADLEGYYSNSGSGFEGVTPVRVLDTRNEIGTTARGPVAADGTVRLNLSGTVPAGATAAVLNLTVTQPKDSGIIVAYADGQPVPGTSNLNFVSGQTIPNQVIVPLTNDIADFSNGSAGTVQLIADLEGYYASGAPGSFVPDGPSRIVDTRVGLGVPTGPVPADSRLVISTPEADVADVLNVTVTQPKSGGDLVVFPNIGPVPGTSDLNFTADQTIANLVTVEPNDGEVAIYNSSSGSVQVVVDEQGFFIDQQ